MKRKTYSKFIVVLFCLVLFLKSIGGLFHLINIGIPMGMILLMGGLSVFEKKYLTIKTFSFIIISFLLLVLAGVLYSNAPIYGLNKTGTLALFVILALISAKAIVQNVDTFLKVNFIFFLIYLAAYFFFFGSLDNVLKSLSVSNREEMGGEAFHVINASRYIGFSLINTFFLYLSLNKKNVVTHIIAGVLFILGLVIMILFGTKGPIVAMILAPVLLFLFHQNLSLKKVAVLSLTAGLIVVYFFNPDVFLNFIPTQYHPYFEYRFFDIERIQGDRFSHFEKLASDIDFGSIFFGKGTGNFGYLHFGQDMRYYPHNIFAELFYENGLVGLLFFISVLINVLAIKLKLNSYHQFYVVILVYYYLLNAQVSGDIASNAFLFVFLIVLNQMNFVRKKATQSYQ